MNLAIDFAEADITTVEYPTMQMLVITDELRVFVGQLEDLRLFGCRLTARTLYKIEFGANGTCLSKDEWFALRHGVVDFLVTAKNHRHSDNFVVVKPEGHPKLKTLRNKNLIPVSTTPRLSKQILGEDRSDYDHSQFMKQNFFRPQEFIGDFSLTDFIL
jgi:hypothetical protein